MPGLLVRLAHVSYGGDDMTPPVGDYWLTNVLLGPVLTSMPPGTWELVGGRVSYAGSSVVVIRQVSQ